MDWSSVKLLHNKVIIKPLLLEGDEFTGKTRLTGSGSLVIHRGFFGESEYAHNVGVVVNPGMSLNYYGDEYKTLKGRSTKLVIGESNSVEWSLLKSKERMRIMKEADPYSKSLGNLYKKSVKCLTEYGNELDEGDIVYFDKNLESGVSQGFREADKLEGGQFIIDYDDLFCAVKQVDSQYYIESKGTGGVGTIIMLNGWCLMEPEKEKLEFGGFKKDLKFAGYGTVAKTGSLVTGYIEDHSPDQDNLFVGQRIKIDQRKSGKFIGNDITLCDERLVNKRLFQRKDVQVIY